MRQLASPTVGFASHDRRPDPSGLAGPRGAQLKATQALLDASPRVAAQQRLRAVVQCTKKRAHAYIEKQGLGIESGHQAIESFICDTSQDEIHRKGLLDAWNSKQKGPMWWINPPEDLLPKSVEMQGVEDLSGWDSDLEDKLDLDQTITKKRKRAHSLVRGDGKTIADVPELSLFDGIRLGRQVVKRDAYDRLPFICQVGPQLFEFCNPGTKDVYATPLTGDRDRYKRAGTSSAYNFQNLTSRLEQQAEQPETKRKKIQTVFDTFRGQNGELGETQAEVIAAIACDFMKGSGAIEFVEEARKKSEEGEASEFSFKPFFTGDNPYYLPAKTGGRAKVRERTELRKKRRDSSKKGHESTGP